MIQVFTFGHPLNEHTKMWVKKLDGKGDPNKGRCREYHQHLHIPNFSQTLEFMTEFFNKLETLNPKPDLTGHTRTLIVPPGSSIATAAVVAAWYGRTGDLPEILNLIRRGPGGIHIPAPEKGSLDLNGYALNQMQTSGDPELLNLHSIKAQIRKQRINDRAHGQPVVFES